MTDETIESAIALITREVESQQTLLTQIADSCRVFRSDLEAFKKSLPAEQVEIIRQIGANYTGEDWGNFFASSKGRLDADLDIALVENMIGRLKVVCDVINAKKAMENQWPQNTPFQENLRAEQDNLREFLPLVKSDYQRHGEKRAKDGMVIYDERAQAAFVYAGGTIENPGGHHFKSEDHNPDAYRRRLRLGQADYALSCTQSIYLKLTYATKLLGLAALSAHFVPSLPLPEGWMKRVEGILDETGPKLTGIKTYLGQIQGVSEGRSQSNIVARMTYDS